MGVIGQEQGVSCYEFRTTGEGYIQIILPGCNPGLAFDAHNLLSAFIGGEIPAHIIEGLQVGVGAFGEPVVSNPKILAKVSFISTETKEFGLIKLDNLQMTAPKTNGINIKTHE